MLRQRLSNIRSRITQVAQRAGRDPSEIQLTAVTKNVSVETIREAIELGVRHIGESKVQEALGKYKELKRTMDEGRWTNDGGERVTGHGSRSTVQWHLIGHLQTNKVRDAVRIFDWIHSVDSLHLAEKIHQECEKIQKVMPVLIEVNVSGEQSKFGTSPKDLPELIKSCQPLQSIRVEGLMTMAPVVSNPNQVRPYFRRLRQLAEGASPLFSFKKGAGTFELSMGMSQDFEVAIEEGATMVRIGAAIFR